MAKACGDTSLIDASAGIVSPKKSGPPRAPRTPGIQIRIPVFCSRCSRCSWWLILSGLHLKPFVIRRCRDEFADVRDHFRHARREMEIAVRVGLDEVLIDALLHHRAKRFP